MNSEANGMHVHMKDLGAGVSHPGIPDELICLNCRSLMAGSAKPLLCFHCNASYQNPGHIPVLMKDSKGYIASLYAQYARHLQAEQILLTRLVAAREADPLRRNTLRNQQNALEANREYIKRIQAILQIEVDVEKLALLLHEPDTVSYAAEFDYLRRDWCWMPEGEEELDLLKNTLMELIRDQAPDTEAALVIGAGTGRLAWDIRHVFNKVNAMDRSYLMAHQFHTLFEEDIRFFEIRTKNLMRTGDGVRMLRASLLPPWEDTIEVRDQENVCYFVADANDIPLADQSMSCILSVYFTDVVPLRPFLKEIKRVLKPTGLFVHFGPLDYHFEDTAKRLSAEEVKVQFLAAGFDLIDQRVVTSQHLKSVGSMTTKSYDNWAFAAVKKNRRGVGLVVTEHTVLSLKQEIRYDAKGVLTSHQETLIEVNLYFNGQEVYGGAIAVLDILRLVDGNKTVCEVLDILATEYDLGEDVARKDVMRSMQVLVEKEILSIQTV
jgi:carnosine N-methyltransferase